MNPRSSLGAAVLVALGAIVAAGPSAEAGAGHAGSVFHAGGGAHGGFHGVGAGFHGRGSFGRLPPVSGVIHERAGMRPYFSTYGHTNTAVPRVAFNRSGAVRPGFAGYGHTNTASTFGGFGGRSTSRYGYLGTGYAPDRGVDRLGFRNRPSFGDHRGRPLYGRIAGGYGGGGYGGGGYGGGWGETYAGGSATSGTSGGQDTYGNQGTYGTQGIYGNQGTYGSQGTYGTQGTYGGDGESGPRRSYLSEVPLAARFAEPPLAPSPYGDADSYAYAASADVDHGGRSGIVWVNSHERSGCGCGPRVHATPVVYRYGVGTAY